MQEKRKFYSCPITLFDKNEIRVTPFVGVTLIILVLSQFVQPLTYNLVVGIFILLLHLYPQYNEPGIYIQPCIPYPACPENLGTLPVCVQKIGLTYMIGIAESWNGKCRKRNRHHKTLVFVGGHHESVGIHYIFRRISIVKAVIKSPVKGHGGHISDCAQLEPYLVLAYCTVQILLHRCLDLILVHHLQVIHLACYKYL